MKYRNLWKVNVLIDAEGRCENYELHCYVIAEDYLTARQAVKKQCEEEGENIISVGDAERISYALITEER